MTVLLTNNVSTTLAASIAAGDATFNVVDGNRFPSPTTGQYAYATIIAPNGAVEIVKITSRIGNALGVVRAQDGTSAQVFPAGSRVELRVTAGSILDAVADGVAEFDADIAALDLRLDTAEAELISLDGRLDTAESDITALEGRMTTAEGDITTIEGDIVALEAFDTTLGTSAGSNSVGFLQAGVGAAARTVQGKLREVISVKDFGAVGNGIADDTTAIQNAVVAANGKAVYFPSGTYKTTATTFSSISDITIFGDGFSSIVQVSTPIDAWQFNATCSDINVHSMAFIGASVATEGKIAIEIKSPRTTIQNCYVADFNRGVSITSETANDCSIVNNVFENIVGATSGNGYATYTIGQRTVIANNHFVNVGRHDVYLSGSIPQGAQYCVVSNNTSVGCGYEAIALYATATQDAVKGCIVSNNSIKDPTNIGIGLGQNVVDCVISGNYVVGAGSFGIYLNGSTALNTYPSRNTISANVVVDAGTRQINLLNAINNTIVGNSTSAISVTPATLFGVTVSYTGTPVTFPTGNIVSGTVATGISPVKIDSLSGVFCGINARAEQEEWLTAADGDTTPSVKDAKRLVIANTTATTITNFDDGVDGQEITLFFTNANTTVNRANAFLSGNVNFVSSANDTLTLVRKSPYWYEKARGVN